MRSGTPIRTGAGPVVGTLGTMLEMAELGTAVCLQLVDASGVVLWEAVSDAGVTRMHAAPPADHLARAHQLHIHLEQLPLAGEPPQSPYLADLHCGCLVGYTYRPGLSAHCPTHGMVRVRRVDYPAQEMR